LIYHLTCHRRVCKAFYHALGEYGIFYILACVFQNFNPIFFLDPY
jgi:hypothetical protein